MAGIRGLEILDLGIWIEEGNSRGGSELSISNGQLAMVNAEGNSGELGGTQER